MKPKLKILVGGAKHFLSWELPYLEKHFRIVQETNEETILLVYGPDVLQVAANVPALRRVAILFPGYNFHPYHNIAQRKEALHIIDSHYDLVFVNPGPVEEALKTSKKVVSCAFTIATPTLQCKQFRKALNSLVHVSADSPQKDWKRSATIMKLTGLPHEVFPPRYSDLQTLGKMKYRMNQYWTRLNKSQTFLTKHGYVEHERVIRKYQQYDGFVHVAAEHPCYEDGKYTAALLEAGATGAILFWHDTLGLGKCLETVFDLPSEPQTAANELLHIKRYLDVEKHSRLTREEILDRHDPDKVIRLRATRIKEML